MRLLSFYVLACLLFTSTGCDKNTDAANENPPGGGSGVYAVYSKGGQWNNRKAFLWKDDTQTDLSNTNPLFSTTGTNLYSTAVAVSTTGDVYVAGGECLKVRQDFPFSSEFIDSCYTVLWKNGVKQNLNSVAVDRWFMKGFDVDMALNSNNDVFVMGRDGAASAGDYSVWKNGTRTIEIRDDWADLNDLFVKVNDVYVCGRTYNAASGLYVTALWKNGVYQALPGNVYALCGAVADNNDVYVGLLNGKIVKNNIVQPTLLSAAGNAANAIEDIVCAGSDVYALGTATGGENIIWKNGTQVYKLTSPNPVYTTMFIQSLFVSGSDVYVSAVLVNSTTSSGGPSAAVLFKNGVLYKTLFDGNGTLVSAPAVFVK